jgi:hypothetical protein
MKAKTQGRSTQKPRLPASVHEEVNHLILDVEPPHSENEWNQMGFRIYVHKRKHIYNDRFLVWTH